MRKFGVFTRSVIAYILATDFSWVHEFEVSWEDAQALLSEAWKLLESILIFVEKVFHQLQFVFPGGTVGIQVSYFLDELINSAAVIIILSYGACIRLLVMIIVILKITGIVGLLRLFALLVNLGLAIHLVEPVVLHDHYLPCSKMGRQIHRSVISLLPYCGSVTMDNVFILKIPGLISIDIYIGFIPPLGVYAVSCHLGSFGWLPTSHLVSEPNDICILSHLSFSMV